MKEEMKMQDLEKVTGGDYDLRLDTYKIGFTKAMRGFKLKETTNLYQVQAELNALIGKFHTEEEFDNECIKLLYANDWVESELGK